MLELFRGRSCHWDSSVLLATKGTSKDAALYIALYIAAQNGRLTGVTQLIQDGADVNTAGSSDGCTPLWIAAQNGHAAVVAKLLQHGADKSIRGLHNETPLGAAVRMNHVAVIALLAGAEVRV